MLPFQCILQAAVDDEQSIEEDDRELFNVILSFLCCFVSIERCGWLSFGDFNLFFRFVLQQDQVSSTLCFGGAVLQACICWGVPPADILSAVARSRCKQRVVFAVFKALCVAMAFAGVPIPYCHFSAFFKFRWTTNNRMKKTTRDLFSVILFSLYHLVSNCPSIVLPIIFLNMNQI